MVELIVSFPVFNVMLKLISILILGLMVAKIVDVCLQ